jgi:hypothetical protein
VHSFLPGPTLRYCGACMVSNNCSDTCKHEFNFPVASWPIPAYWLGGHCTRRCTLGYGWIFTPEPLK